MKSFILKSHIIVLLLLVTFLTGCSRGTKSSSGTLDWNYEYYDSGLIKKITDPGGKTTDFNYSFFPANSKAVQRMERTTADGKVIYVFNEKEQLQQMIDKLGTTLYSYDQSGNLTSINHNNSPSIYYTYNSSGRVLSCSMSNGYNVEYNYDFLNRLTAIKSPAGVITYSYLTGNGIILRQLPNGIRTQYKYLPDGKTESITHVGKDNYIIMKYSYTYNPDGLISSVIEWTTQGEHKLSYEYDQEQRLIVFTDKNGTKTEYQYDDFGNRTEVDFNNNPIDSYTYDWFGRILMANGKPYEYDKSGNLISTNVNGKEYLYNGNNQLQKVKDITYEYDGIGLLVARNQNNQKSSFICNPLSDVWQPLSSVSNDNKETFYIWEGNSPVAAIENGKVNFLLTDQLSSIRGIADENGKLNKQINYSPFGVPDQEFSSGILIPGFTGLFYEPDAKLYLTKTRAYNPKIGRFMQIDPLHHTPAASQENLSSYTYCGGDPINYFDRKGTQSTHFDIKNFLADAFTFKDEWQFWEDMKNKSVENPNRFLGFSQFLISDYLQGSMQVLYHANQVGELYMNQNASIWDKSRATLGLGIESYLTASGFAGGNIIENNVGKFVGKEIYSTLKDVPNRVIYAYVIKEGVAKTLVNKGLEATNETVYPNFNTEASVENSSNVGGVYLGGAGKTLDGLGQLSGIAVDESNGKLILISEDKGKIDLPPLRLDDMVTVFRSVYQHGEAPFVSIDPDPQNPKGPVMKSRHGEATRNTYVGWILFEADRIMKAFSLGEDNITKKPVQTRITGYDKVLDAMFVTDNKQETWERFWIVPAKVEKNVSSKNDITMFDVPLMVKTQKMNLRNGKLEPSPDGKISKGAQEFANWFTINYDRLAQESYSLPPKGSGFNSPVPVFKELQRIALMTAIAEQLRNQGIEFPFWMRSYEVKTFQTPETTPAHSVVKNNGNSILSVYGGVNLSPSDENVITRTASPVANGINDRISETTKTLPYFKTADLNSGNKTYKVSSLPGADAKDIGPCILNETDLSVRINGDRYLSLTRKFNSFISPMDKEYGKVWSLDLPILEKQKVPVNRIGDAEKYTYAYHLISPMNNFSRKIDKLYTENNGKIGFNTSVVFQNNAKLHFNNDGYLAAYEDKPVTILYNRDKNNRIFQIAGMYGNMVLADIKLKYDNYNRIVSAAGSNGETVTYNYSNNGTLSEVSNSKDKVTYGYDKDFVSDIKRNDDPLKQFKYNPKGQLLSKTENGISEQLNNIQQLPNGYLMTTSIKSGFPKKEKGFFSFLNFAKEDKNIEPKVAKEIIQYDYSYRPVRRVFEDGSSLTLDYSIKDFTRLELIGADGNKLNVMKSTDNKDIFYSMADGTNYHEVYDENRQLLSQIRNNQPIFQQRWNPGGTLALTEYDTHALHYDYTKDGVLQRILITPPGEEHSWSQWKSYSYDTLGNLSEVSDFTGMRTHYSYDKEGNLNFIASNQDSVLIKNSEGRIANIENSHGSRMSFSYDDKGNIKKISNSKGGDNSNIQFQNQQISEINRFNGASYSFYYSSNKNNNILLAKIKTPSNKLEYEYNDNSTLSSVLCNNKYMIGYKYDKNGRLSRIKYSSN